MTTEQVISRLKLEPTGTKTYIRVGDFLYPIAKVESAILPGEKYPCALISASIRLDPKKMERRSQSPNQNDYNQNNKD